MFAKLLSFFKPKGPKITSFDAGSFGVSVSRLRVGDQEIHIQGKRLFVNGVEWAPLPPEEAGKFNLLVMDQEGVVKGPVQGDLYVQNASYINLVIKGDVNGSISVGHGNVTAANVRGSISAQDVYCHDVGGNVSGRDIHCGRISGSASARGDISGRR